MKAIENWQDVNAALGRLAKLEAEAKETKDSIKDFAQRHKRELDGKSMTLNNGLVGYRVEEKAAFDDEAEAISILQDNGYCDLVKVGVDRPALARNEEALALIPGAKIERKLVFVCKPNAVKKPKEQRG